MRKVATAVLFLSFCAAPASAATLALRCEGIATYPGAETASASVFSNGQSATGTATTSVLRRSNEVVSVAIDGNAARVRLPRSMVPTINSGGQDGWWVLTEFSATETEFRGRFRLNPFNKPTIRIDRTTGDLSLEGAFRLSFQGACAPQPVGRLF